MATPGWYPDGQGSIRWFDGTAWTEHVAPAQTIGAYPISAELGRGAFGTVYLGTHPTTGQQVALKVFDRPTASARADLLREAQALVAVRHGNCLQIFDVVDTSDRLALVTDFVPGATLRAVLDEYGALDGPQALQVLWGAAHGLDAVHRAGLVHGDVKPANILVQPDGISKLIDFGLVGVPGLSSPDGSVSGSPAYAAPEQMIQGVRTPQSDIYSLAVTLYEVLCQERPYKAQSMESLAIAHAGEPVPDPRAIRPQIGAGLAALVIDGMAKNPADRPASVQEFLSRFKEAADQAYGPGWLVAGGLAAIAAGVAGGGLASGVVAASSSAAVASAAAVGASAGSSTVTGGLVSTIGAKIAAASVAAAVVVGGGTAATIALIHKPAASAVATTQIITLDPLNSSGGVAAGWTVDPRTVNVPNVTVGGSPSDPADCSAMTESAFAIGPDTYGQYSCGDMAASLIACWRTADHPGELLCLEDAEDVAARHLTAMTIGVAPGPTPAAKDPVPMVVELSDGSQWMSPSHYQFQPRKDGLMAGYLCANHVGICATPLNDDTFEGILGDGDGELFDKSKPLWTVKIGAENYMNAVAQPKPLTMTVTKAWFVSGALPDGGTLPALLDSNADRAQAGETFCGGWSSHGANQQHVYALGIRCDQSNLLLLEYLRNAAVRGDFYCMGFQNGSQWCNRGKVMRESGGSLDMGSDHVRVVDIGGSPKPTT